MPWSHRAALAAVSCTLAFLIASCDRPGANASNTVGPTTTASSLPAQFSQSISLSQAEISLSGATRVNVEVAPDSLVARRVEIQDADDLNNPEVIHAAVTALGIGSDGVDTLTLALGGIQVTFNASTNFHGLDAQDNDSTATAMATFVSRVQAALAAGHQPGVEAARPAPATPQSPTDATFLAAELLLDDAGTVPFVSMNVTSANLLSNATPPPDGWLELLEVKIALELSTGATKLLEENSVLHGVRPFKARVDSVNTTAGTVSLMNGTVLKIVAGTEIRVEPKDLNVLSSLPAVQAALAQGDTVRAEGTALEVTTDPDTLAVVRVEFVIVTARPRVHVPGIYAFADTIVSVDTTGSTLTLANGLVVRVVAGTLVVGGAGLTSLSLVADSLAAKDPLWASGRGLLETSGPPEVLDAIVLALSGGTPPRVADH